MNKNSEEWWVKNMNEFVEFVIDHAWLVRHYPESFTTHPDEQEIKPATEGKRGELILPRSFLAAMPEYSCSLPSGKYMGKRWRISTTAFTDKFKEETQEWIVAKYVEDPEPDMIGILYWYALDQNKEPHRGDLNETI